MEFKHIPVLFRESIDALDIKPDGLYADCTAGGGGHSNAILDRLSENGRLVAIDRDPEAIETLTKRFEGRENVSIVNDNFFNIKSILSQFTDEGADGILADLGVSSHQLDDAARGFSFHADAPLDMRMSMQGMSAADAVNSLSQRELQDIIYRYGEDKFAPRIAAGIVRARAEKPIETTLELAEIVKSSIPAAARREGGHPARRTFQALRIYVNGELDGLDRAIGDMFDSLKVGGRLDEGEVIGICPDIHYRPLQYLTEPFAFVTGTCWQTRMSRFYVRLAAGFDLDAVCEGIREKARKFDPDSEVADFRFFD